MDKQDSTLNEQTNEYEDGDVSASSLQSTHSNASNESTGFVTSKKDKKKKFQIKKDAKLKKKTSKKWKPEKISKKDFFNKTSEFRMYLLEMKCLNLDEMTSEKAKQHFKKFVKKWNNKKLAQKYYVGADPMWTVSSPSIYSRISVGDQDQVDANCVTPKGASPLYTESKFSTFGKKRGRKVFAELSQSVNLPLAKPLEQFSNDVAGESPVWTRSQIFTEASLNLTTRRRSYGGRSNNGSPSSAMSFEGYLVNTATIGRRNMRTRASMKSLLSMNYGMTPKPVAIPTIAPSANSECTGMKHSCSSLPPPPDFLLLPPPREFQTSSSSLSSCSSYGDPDCQLMPPPSSRMPRQMSMSSTMSTRSSTSSNNADAKPAQRARSDSLTSVSSVSSTGSTRTVGKRPAPPPPPRRTPFRKSSTSSTKSAASDDLSANLATPRPVRITRMSSSYLEIRRSSSSLAASSSLEMASSSLGMGRSSSSLAASSSLGMRRSSSSLAASSSLGIRRSSSSSLAASSSLGTRRSLSSSLAGYGSVSDKPPLCKPAKHVVKYSESGTQSNIAATKPPAGRMTRGTSAGLISSPDTTGKPRRRTSSASMSPTQQATAVKKKAPPPPPPRTRPLSDLFPEHSPANIYCGRRRSVAAPKVSAAPVDLPCWRWSIAAAADAVQDYNAKTSINKKAEGPDDEKMQPDTEGRRTRSRSAHVEPEPKNRGQTPAQTPGASSASSKTHTVGQISALPNLDIVTQRLSPRRREQTPRLGHGYSPARKDQSPHSPAPLPHHTHGISTNGTLSMRAKKGLFTRAPARPPNPNSGQIPKAPPLPPMAQEFRSMMDTSRYVLANRKRDHAKGSAENLASTPDIKKKKGNNPLMPVYV